MSDNKREKKDARRVVTRLRPLQFEALRRYIDNFPDTEESEVMREAFQIWAERKGLIPELGKRPS